MLLDRHAGATEAGDRLSGLLATWPPNVPVETRGYRPADLDATRPQAVCDLGEGRLVVAAAHESGPVTALPCVARGTRLDLAVAGDGVAAALIARSEARSEPLPSGFTLTRHDQRPLAAGAERDLGTDQSNISVIVGDEAIVKWRSAPDANGGRANRLRRHAQANGFSRTPALLASLAWRDGAGRTWILADVDALLPGAVDGWDHAIASLRSALEASAAIDAGYAESVGQLTAALHAALLRPSEVIARPTREATPAEMVAMRDGGLSLLQRTLAIEADDQDVVISRASHLRQAIERGARASTPLGPIHGDLHIGQLVPWRDGMDVIDFDGAPEPTAPVGDLDAPARDVAQMTCSLWSVAAVVDERTEGAHTPRLQEWATSAEQAFLRTYRRGLQQSGIDTHEGELFEAFMAEQLCRELLYAESTLPRWRYAPLQALRWRFPQ